MRIEWQEYGEGRETGVREFALLPDAIALRFQDGRVYLYDATSPGQTEVQRMRNLALNGSGLTTYVNRFVRERHAGRVV